MGMTVHIIEEVETDEELITLMEHITAQLKQGYLQGTSPHWGVIEVEPSDKGL